MAALELNDPPAVPAKYYGAGKTRRKRDGHHSVTPDPRIPHQPRIFEGFGGVYQAVGPGTACRMDSQMFIDWLDREGRSGGDKPGCDSPWAEDPNEACADLVRNIPAYRHGRVDPSRKGGRFRAGTQSKTWGYKGMYIQIQYLTTAPTPLMKMPGTGTVYRDSMHFNCHADLCRPLYLDYVAVDFPDLRLVGSTPGWPWVAELMGVAWRHPNIYVATSVVRPKLFGNPLSGYETLIQFQHLLQIESSLAGVGTAHEKVEEIRVYC
jgi:hypothetical protein